MSTGNVAFEIGDRISLPAPRTEGSVTLESTLATRRSRRELTFEPVDRTAVGQLLWAAQGRTDPEGKRAAPSAGATYPLIVDLVVGEGGVPDLAAGVYRYDPDDHAIEYRSVEPVQAELESATGGQEYVSRAAIDVVMAGIEERTAREYGERAGELYVPMEAGHAGENLFLQAEALGLASVPVGGFEDAAVAAAMGYERARPLVMYPVGGRPD
ncbi:MAG: SagB/ThcOx family dehydrogenase [Halodesulfurarchaeum sp.]|nr:SagB/ThcOx family dehydrogenase [Halodesulfurarchaeum sp.]